MAEIEFTPLIGYARVSTQEQETTLQLDALRAAGVSKIYEEKASGASLERRHVLKINWNGPLFGNAPSPGKKQQLPVVRGLAVGAL